MTNEEYIQELEALVCFYAKAYEANADIFYRPKSFPITDKEKENLMKFSSIQGSRQRFGVEKLSKINIPRTKKYNIDIVIDELIKNSLKYET